MKNLATLTFVLICIAAFAGQARSQSNNCTYTLSSVGQSFASSGGTATVTVSTADGCAFTATVQNANSFLTIIDGASGTGSGTVKFAIAQNTGAARTGTIFIAGQTYTLSQGGVVRRKKILLSPAPTQ